MTTSAKTIITGIRIDDLDVPLKRLNLKNMKNDIIELTQNPQSASCSLVDLMFTVMKNEVQRRENNALQKRLKEANLKYSNAAFTELDLKVPRGLNKQQIKNLMSCDWIRYHQNCTIVGASGLGKSWIANMLAIAAVTQGFKAKVVRVPRFLQEVFAARQVPTEYRKTLAIYKKVDLLVLDEWGIGQLDANARSNLLEVIEDCHQVASTVITSMLPVQTWPEYIGDVTYSDAILDRLLQNAHRIELEGLSLRAMPIYGVVNND